MFIVKLDSTFSKEEYNFENTINVYSNTSTGSFTINFTDIQGNEAEIKVLDLLGKTVYYEKAVIINELKEIDLGKIIKGIYFIQVNSGNKQSIKKLIIE